MSGLKPFLSLVADGKTLSETQARDAFSVIMAGEATDAQIGGFLMALRMRGETIDEITGAALILREKAVRVTAPQGAIDTCGTGGDSKGTFNVSTAAAITAAAAGVPVAKHGNKAQTSKSGSADVLAALGVNLDADTAIVEEAMVEAGIGFLMAPRHHGAMGHVANARGQLGIRTIFNLLGPLANPAGAKRQLIGVFSRAWIEPMAQVLGRLGVERAWVVHGSDGMDEITTTGPSYVAELKDGKVTTFEVGPGDADLPLAEEADLLGGEAQENAEILHALLDGEQGPIRDIVVLNAAAALVVAEKAEDLRQGARMAQEAIDSGKGKETLARLVEITNKTAG